MNYQRVLLRLSLTQRGARAAVCLLVVGLVGVFLYWHMKRTYPFFADDGFISLRYSHRLLEGRGLTWDDFERVEGYSNLLWVLLCAVPGLFGVDLVLGARCLGFLSVLATVLALIYWANPKSMRDWFALLAGALMFVATNAVAVWSTGGLEQPLLVALLAWCVALCARAEGDSRSSSLGAPVLAGLACWVRPDTPLLVGAIAFGLWAGNPGRELRVPLRIVAGVCTFVGVQLVFRWFYYHDLVPNTAYAKVAFTPQRLQLGLNYIRGSLVPLAASWGLILVGAAAVLVHREMRRRLLPLILPVMVWAPYVIFVGGDIFPTWRQLLVVPMVGAFLLTEFGIRAYRSERTSLGLVVLIPLLAWTSGFHDPGNRAQGERWEWVGRSLGITLRASLKKNKPLIGVDGAGALPYYSGFAAVDLLGLNDRYLAHHRPESMGTGHLAHELGDASYYASRKIDLYCFGTPPCSRSPRFSESKKLAATPEFRANYVAVQIRFKSGKEEESGVLWVRKHGRAGVALLDRKISIPGYLFATQSGVAAFAHRNSLIADFEPNRSAKLELSDLPPGRYEARLYGRASTETAIIQVTQKEASQRSEAGGHLEFELTESRRAIFQVESGSKGLKLLSLELEMKAPLDSPQHP